MKQTQSKSYIRRQIRNGSAIKDGITLDFWTIRSDAADAFERHVENLDGTVYERRRARYETVSGRVRNGHKIVAYVNEDIYADLIDGPF